MPTHGPSHHTPPQANTSTPIVFGRFPTRTISNVDTVVPKESFFSQFSQRSFHRVAIVLGVGSAALVAWFLFQEYRARREHAAEIQQKEEVEELIQEEVVKEEIIVEEEDEPIGNVILYQCPRGYFTPCIAPFALKLETFLRVATIPYEVKFTGQPQADDSPWITIGTRDITEPQKCIPTLCRLFDVNLDIGASESRKSASNLVDNTLENKIYWGVALWRWVYDGGNSMKEIQPLAAPLASQMAIDVSDSVKKAAWYHGIGRLNPDEVVETINKDLLDISKALGRHPFFLGDHPGIVDCNAFAMLAQIVWNMPRSPFEKEIQKYPNLISFVFRMKEKYWPDWNDILNYSEDTDLASESVHLYRTGEFTRSSTQISAKASKTGSGIQISTDLPLSTKSKRSLPQIHGQSVPAPETSEEIRQNRPSSANRSDEKKESQSTKRSKSLKANPVVENVEAKNGMMNIHLEDNTRREEPGLAYFKNQQNFSESIPKDNPKNELNEEGQNLSSGNALYETNQSNLNYSSNQQPRQFPGSKSAPFPYAYMDFQTNNPQSYQQRPYSANEERLFAVRDNMEIAMAQANGGPKQDITGNIIKLNQILHDLEEQGVHMNRHFNNWTTPTVGLPNNLFTVDNRYAEQQQQLPFAGNTGRAPNYTNNPFL